MADGLRKTPKLRLEILEDADLPGWVRRGRWGDTQPRIPGLHQPSPEGPLPHQQWGDPKRLLEEAVTAKRLEATPPPEVTIVRADGRMKLSFDFSRRGQALPERLVVAVNSEQDERQPRVFTFALDPVVRGTLETDIELVVGKDYDIYVSTVDADGRPSKSVLVPPAEPAPNIKPWQRPLFALRGLVARLRGHRRS
jgi:hypothetical protein